MKKETVPGSLDHKKEANAIFYEAKGDVFFPHFFLKNCAHRQKEKVK
jgi:hypothetical protein